MHDNLPSPPESGFPPASAQNRSNTYRLPPPHRRHPAEVLSAVHNSRSYCRDSPKSPHAAGFASCPLTQTSMPHRHPHKDLKDDDKWVAGPVWDLVCYNREKTDYTFRMKAHYGFTPHWIGEIIRYESFCRAVKSVWNEVYPVKLTEIYDYIDCLVLPLDKAWENDCRRWKEDPSQTAAVRADRIKNALKRNIEWFNGHVPVAASY